MGMRVLLAVYGVNADGCRVKEGVLPLSDGDDDQVLIGAAFSRSQSARKTPSNPARPSWAFWPNRSVIQLSNLSARLRQMAIRDWISAVWENNVWCKGFEGFGV